LKINPKKASSNDIIQDGKENNKFEQEENKNFKTKEQFLAYKEKKLEGRL